MKKIIVFAVCCITFLSCDKSIDELFCSYGQNDIQVIKDPVSPIQIVGWQKILKFELELLSKDCKSGKLLYEADVIFYNNGVNKDNQGTIRVTSERFYTITLNAPEEKIKKVLMRIYTDTDANDEDEWVLIEEIPFYGY